MNSFSERSFKIDSWFTVVMVALGFWLSCSLLIDTVIIPGLSAAGMMAEVGFASAGFLIFGLFNRLELLCAALTLTGFLIFRRHRTFSYQQERWSIILSGILLAIALSYTYIFTPQISGWGLQLNLFAPAASMPSAMVVLHGTYWTLEIIKFLAGVTLLRWCYRNSCQLN